MVKHSVHGQFIPELFYSKLDVAALTHVLYTSNLQIPADLRPVIEQNVHKLHPPLHHIFSMYLLYSNTMPF